MKISKRAHNQKKRSQSQSVSRKQRGASDPDRVRQFYVYYNYILSDFQGEGGRNGELLTRQLNAYEFAICQDWITETRDVIIDDGRDYDFAALEVGVITQLQQPRNGKHFRINFTVRNKSHEEAIELIHEYMEEVYAGGYIEFDNQYYRVHESNDQNSYYSTPGQQVDITDLVSGGYRKQRGARPPRLIPEQRFNVYYNYLTRDLENQERDKTVLLTRKLNLYELSAGQKQMKKANTLTDLLHVHDIEQLQEPRNNNHFRVTLTIKNTTASDCLSIITDYMDMAAEGDNLVFHDTVKSTDRNQYQNSCGKLEITDFDTDF
jgi:hypothetical protein